MVLSDNVSYRRVDVEDSIQKILVNCFYFYVL